MAKVVMYTRDFCSYCDSAKTFLKSKGVEFEEINLSENPEKLEEMVSLARRKSVPQIFINDKSVGGFDDINALNRTGDLDKMLGK